MDQPTTHLPQTVFMFSGQGSQKVGMGASLFENSAVASVFECASDVFGLDVTKLILEGDQETLNDTQNAQVAISSLSIGIAQALQEVGAQPAYTIGFSLGQISALPIAGFLSIEETFELLRVRSSVMAEAAIENPGAMCVLLGASEDLARELCEQCAEGDVLVPANYNCPGQIVISGSKDAICRAQKAWTEQKKKALPMATSGAFHSPLMEPAAKALRDYLESVEFSEPQIPLINNVDARPLERDTICDQLSQHLTHPVLFDKSIEYLSDQGELTYVEVGYGGVLFGLVKRIDKSLAKYKVEDKESFEALSEAYVAQS